MHPAADHDQSRAFIEKRLASLAIPQDLTGKTVLDLDCGNGEIALEFLRRGAAKVVALSPTTGFAKNSAEQDRGISFVQGSWRDLPEADFDMVFCPATLHAESSLAPFLAKMKSILAQEGILILESIVSWGEGLFWDRVSYGDGHVLSPTWDLLRNSLLAHFAVRTIGTGVDTRYFVFHCTTYRPIVLLIVGPSGVGKTTLASQLQLRGAVTFSTDEIIRLIGEQRIDALTDIEVQIRDNFDPHRIDLLTDEIVRRGHGEHLARMIFERLPKDAAIVAVEGYSITHEKVLSPLKALLKQQRLKVWTVS